MAGKWKHEETKWNFMAKKERGKLWHEKKRKWRGGGGIMAEIYMKKIMAEKMENYD